VTAEPVAVADEDLARLVASRVREVPDFPQLGVLF